MTLAGQRGGTGEDSPLPPQATPSLTGSVFTCGSSLPVKSAEATPDCRTSRGHYPSSHRPHLSALFQQCGIGPVAGTQSEADAMSTRETKTRRELTENRCFGNAI